MPEKRFTEAGFDSGNPEMIRLHRLVGQLLQFPRHLSQHVGGFVLRSEEHTSELQSLMRISYAVFCLKKKKDNQTTDAYNCKDVVHKQYSKGKHNGNSIKTTRPMTAHQK